MRPTLRPEGFLERLALQFNIAPTPVVEAMFGMASSRVVMAGQRLGVFKVLASGPLTADELASHFGLAPAGTEYLLQCLAALGYLRREPEPQGLAALNFDNPHGGRYHLTSRQRKWLDPASPTYIGDFLEFNYDQWDWWARLEEVVRTGTSHQIHDYADDDPRWRRYITAMFQLARLSAPEVARKLPLPPQPRRLLDLAGGHGWFAAEVCKRHAGLTATVVDLSGSVAIGREIIANAGISDCVRFVEGDILDLPSDQVNGSFDAILCFQIVHHLSPEHNQTLLRRARSLLNPGGVLAVLDYFPPETDRRPDSSAFLGLHFYLTSASQVYHLNDLACWLQEADFTKPKRIRLRSIPIQSLYICHSKD